MDDEVQFALDASPDRLHEAVAEKLTGYPVLEDLENEAAVGTDVETAIDPDIVEQLTMALAYAARKDEIFAATISTLLARIQADEKDAGQQLAGPINVSVSGGIHADHSSAAAATMGTVNVGMVGNSPPDPPSPGR